jgi:hypothetical protein
MQVLVVLRELPVLELSRIDILADVAKQSHCLATPGHLEQLFHIVAFLKCYNRSKLIFDNRQPLIDESRFTKADWSQYYPDAT